MSLRRDPRSILSLRRGPRQNDTPVIKRRMLKKILALVVVLAAAAAADEDALSGPCRDARLVGPGERGGRAIDKYEQCQIAKSDACGNLCGNQPVS